MASVTAIVDQALGGRRITPGEGLKLLKEADLHTLGRAALSIRRRWHPDPIATYVVDRNINYTNVCVTNCDFCAFSRRPKDADAFVLTRADLFKKIRELTAIGGTQIMLQGGHHPRLKLDWYEEMLRGIRGEFPGLHIHAFSPSEIVHFSQTFRLPVRTVIRRLKAAGLNSIPGGGGEILADRVRRLISPRKATTAQWLNVMRVASEEGLKGSCTMVIGHVERPAERIAHLERLRRLQDECRPFGAFIVWTMQPRHTRLEGRIIPAGAVDYLRTLAVARIYLDNIVNLQSGWVTEGPKIGQLSFLFGSNDWGGVMMEENVVREAGTVNSLKVEEMRRLSAELGLQLRKRNFYYEVIEE